MFKGIFVFICLMASATAWAQTKPHPGGLELSAGAALGLNQIPEESELKATGLPLALWGDLGLSRWLRFSGGLLQHHSKLEYTAYGRDWSHRFEVREFYLAYRHLWELNSALDLRSLAGLTQAQATMSTNHDAPQDSASGIGFLLGTGVRYRLGVVDGLELGLDFLITSVSGELGGTQVALGTNQLLLGAVYRF